MVITNELLVHCKFDDADVAPHDDVPVAYEVPNSTAPYKYDDPHS